MSTNVIMPQLGESVIEGTVSDAFEPRQQLPIERAQLHAREMRAETEVHADAEGKMLVRIGAAHVEAEGIAEHRFVAIG